MRCDVNTVLTGAMLEWVGTDRDFKRTGVSAASQPPPAAVLSTAPPSAAVMQSMLLKVPLNLWPVRCW